MRDRDTDPYAALLTNPFAVPVALVDGVREYVDSLRRRGLTGGTLAKDSRRAIDSLLAVAEVGAGLGPGTGVPAGWAHEHPIAREDELTRLHDFTGLTATDTGESATDTGESAAAGDRGQPEKDTADTAATTAPIPTLVLPPQGARTPDLLDYDEDRSFMLSLVRDGHEAPYALEWKSEAPDSTGIVEVVRAIAVAVDHLGGRVRMVGGSQGGWMAVIYAAMHPEQVADLTLVGAPVDFHAGSLLGHAGGFLSWWMTETPMRPMTEAMLPFAAEFQRTTLGSGLWWFTDPVGELARAARTIGHLGDQEALDRNLRNLAMFVDTAPIPSRLYSWFARHLMVGNELARHRLRIGRVVVDPRRITCPLRLVAGRHDRLVPRAQVFRTAALVGTPPDLVTREVLPVGHIGLFTRRVD